MRHSTTLFVIAAVLFTTIPAVQGQQTYSPAWFRTPRAVPQPDIKVRKVIDVTKFGAKPDDGKNDFNAIRKAFDLLNAGEGYARVYFPPGTYNITPPDDRASHCFSVNGCREFVIDGSGAELLIENPAVAFMRFEDCRNAVVKGFEIDYPALPYTQGVIRSVDPQANLFEFEVEEGYPSPLAPNFANAPGGWGVVFDDVPELTLKKGGLNLIPTKNIKAQSESVFRASTTKGAAKAIAPGEKFALIARYNGRSSFQNVRCGQFCFIGIRLYAGPAGGFGMRDCDGVNLLECSVLRKPGRYLSQNADCVHVVPGKIGPWIEGCVFEGQMDDAINLKTEMLTISEIVSPSEYIVMGKVEKGDSLTLFNPREGSLLGKCRVESVKPVKNKSLIKVSADFTNVFVTAGKESDMFFNDNRSNESFVIRNNTFRNFRRYGMLIQATHGTIEGNTLQGLSTGAITMQNSAGWPEGFVPRNVAILDNRISNCGFDWAYFRDGENAAPVVLRTNTVQENGNAKWRGLSNIILRGNTIESNSNYSVYISGAHDVIIEGNQMTQTGPVGVGIFNSDHIVIDGKANSSDHE